MHTACVPADRFLHHRHEGPVRSIADRFGAMYKWAAQRGLQVGLWRADLYLGPVSPR